MGRAARAAGGPVGTALPRLHLVTDASVLCATGFTGLASGVLEAFGPAVALHLRARSFPGGRLYALATELAPVARRTGSLLLVNDRVDVALAAGAGGVQLPGTSLPVAVARRLVGPGLRVGASVHSAAAAAESGRDGAEFVVLGTVYATASHPRGRVAGPARVAEAVAAGSPPVVAIGGISPERVAEVLACGAHGVAVLGGVWRATDPRAAAGVYLDALGSAAPVSGPMAGPKGRTSPRR